MFVMWCVLSASLDNMQTWTCDGMSGWKSQSFRCMSSMPQMLILLRLGKHRSPAKNSRCTALSQVVQECSLQ